MIDVEKRSCSGAMTSREAIETRLKVYEEQTAPLVAIIDKRQLLSHLDASGAVDAVFQKLRSCWHRTGRHDHTQDAGGDRGHGAGVKSGG